MTTPKRRGDAMRRLCSRIHEDDGLPRRLQQRTESRSSSQSSRKDLQVCKQAWRAIACALDTSIADPVAKEARLVAVEPFPTATRLRVFVEPPTKGSVEELLGALVRCRGILRTAVAEACTRKRAPDLVFAIMPAREVADE